ncbi:MAG: hypothetical protein PQJ47_06155 [Sphaerochaetaceae bacterium]|nr:hypothetical protein [Sphaerochaetaceae bacterium]
MIGFFIKKAFFDGWDNLISLVVLNLGYLVVLGALYGVVELFSVSVGLALFAAIVAMALNSLYVAAVNYQTQSLVNGRREGFAHFKEGFAAMFSHAMVHLLVSVVLVTVSIFVIPFYLSYGNLFTLVLAIVLFWVVIIGVFAMFYYYPISIQMPQDGPFKSLKKSLIIVADNIGFTIFFALYQIFLSILSVFFATIMPGVAGLQNAKCVAVSLLMLKYDYLENNPDSQRKNIPWDELLFDEREKVGHRSLRSLIFPWKD